MSHIVKLSRNYSSDKIEISTKPPNVCVGVRLFLHILFVLQVMPWSFCHGMTSLVNIVLCCDLMVLCCR